MKLENGRIHLDRERDERDAAARRDRAVHQSGGLAIGGDVRNE